MCVEKHNVMISPHSFFFKVYEHTCSKICAFLVWNADSHLLHFMRYYKLMGHCLKGKQDIILQAKIMEIQHHTTHCRAIRLQAYIRWYFTLETYWWHGNRYQGTQHNCRSNHHCQTDKKQTAVAQDVWSPVNALKPMLLTMLFSSTLAFVEHILLLASPK